MFIARPPCRSGLPRVPLYYRRDCPKARGHAERITEQAVFAGRPRNAFCLYGERQACVLDERYLDPARYDLAGLCQADPCPLYGPPPGVQSWYVLEVNAGQSRARGINVGDILEFRLK